jgi:uncharacterized repeat protein (TIGR02543 family)
MKQAVKKIFSAVLALCLTASLMPAAFADSATHSVTFSLTNITAQGVNSEELGSTVYVNDGDGFTAILTAASGYTLPESVQVSSLSANNGILSGNNADGTESEDYYNKSSGKIHIASVKKDTDIIASGVPAQAAFSVKLVPTEKSSRWAAGGSAEFSIVLTQTAADAANGGIQTMDFSVIYDAQLSQPEAAASLDSRYGVAVTAKAENHMITVSKTSGDPLMIGIDSSVTLGTVSFTLPSGEYIDKNWPSTGCYKLDDFTVGANGLITTAQAASGVLPTAEQYSASGLFVMHCYLTMPAEYSTLNISGIRYSVKNGDYTAAAPGERVLFPYGQTCRIEITASAGYTLNSDNSVLYTKADSSDGTFTAEAVSANPYLFSTSNGKDLTASGTLRITASPIQYKIQYDANGGTAIADGSYTIADTAKPLAAASRAGYTFNGWKVASAGAQNADTPVSAEYFALNNTYASGEAAALNKAYGDVTLTAQWTADEHTGNTYGTGVAKKSPGGYSHYTITDTAATPAAIDAGTVKSGNAANSVKIKADTGYYLSSVKTTGTANNAGFSAYRTKGAGSWLDSGEDSNLSSNTSTFTVPALGGNRTLSVTASTVTYSVSYDMGDSVGATKATALTSGSYNIETTKFTLPTPVRNGYTFNGWKVTTAPTGGTGFGAVDTVLQAGAITLSGCYGDVALQATWTANEQSAPADGGMPNGTVAKTSPAGTPKTDETVTITVTPPDGQKLSGISASYMKDGKTSTNVVLTADASNPTTGTGMLTYTYVQPNGQVTVTPVFTDISYTVTYVTDGSAVAAGSYNLSTTDFTLPAAPTREGYTFANWKVTAGGSTTATENQVYFKADNTYDASQSITLTQAYGDVTVTAQWNANTQTVTASANPEVSVSPAEIKTGDTVTVTITVPTGKTVSGITITKTTGGADVTSSVDVKHITTGTDGTQKYTYTQPGYGVTITPNYTNIVYTVTYNDNGADTASSGGDKTYTIESTQLKLPTTSPTKAHYTFAGWKVTSRSGGGTGLVEGTTYTENPTLASAYGNVTLTAQWTPDTYTVALDNQSATTAGTASIYESYGVGYYLDSALANQMSASANGITVPVKTGYTFAGYYTEANGAGTQYIDKDGKLTADAANSSFADNAGKLYASWTANIYTITLKPNGGTGGIAAIYEKYGVGFYTDAACTISLSTGFTSPALTGYHFIGYYAGENQIINEAGNINDAYASNTTYTADATLDARYEANGYTVTYDLNYTGAPAGGTANVAYYGNFPTGNVPTRTGYNFLGWYDAADGGSQIVLPAGTSVNTVTGITNSNGDYIKAGDITVYAHWNAKTTAVTLDKQGGTGGTNDISMTYNSATIPTINNPTKANYTFDGWYDTDSYETQVISSTGAANTAASNYFDSNGNWISTNDTVTLYAKWTGERYTLSLDKQDGIGGTDTLYEYYSLKYADAADGYLTSITPPTRTNYVFGGYYTAANGGGTQVIDANGTIISAADAFTSNATLYAKWTGAVYEITLKGKYGDTKGNIYERYGDGYYKTYNSETGEVSNKMTDSANAAPFGTETGYNFNGYFTAESGAGMQIIGSDGYLLTSATAIEYDVNSTTRVLFSSWSAKQTTVSFDLNGGEGATPSSITETYDAANVDATIPTRTGYAFDGWYSTKDNSGYEVFGSNGAAYDGSTTWNRTDKELTLYAHWTGNSHRHNLKEDADGLVTGYIYEVYGTGFYLDETHTKLMTSTTNPVTIPTKAGYTFTGYYMSFGDTMIINANGYLNGDASTYYDDTDDATYTARWVGTEHASNNYGGATKKSPTGNPKTDDTVTITVTPPTGQMIDTLTITDANSTTVLAPDSSTFNPDGGAQDFTFTQPTTDVTIAVTYKYIDYTVTFNDNGATTHHAGGDASYNYKSASVALPTSAPVRTGYTFGGWTISRPEGSAGTVNDGSNDVAANATSVALSSATGSITFTAKWTAQPHNATFSVADVNTSVADSATIAYGDGFTETHQVLTGLAANFTVTTKAGYAVKSVTYATSANGTKTMLTANNGTYTLPANTTGTDYWVYVTTSLDSSKVTGYALNNGTSWQAYSVYSGSKTLVLLKVDDSITGLTTNTGAVVYKTNAYSTGTYNGQTGYNYAVLLDLTGKNIAATQAALNTYLQSILQISATPNSVITYNKNVNGSTEPVFDIDDVSVEYDYSSRSTLNWVPTDAYLMIGDIAGISASDNAPNMILNDYDVAAFNNAHRSV